MKKAQRPFIYLKLYYVNIQFNSSYYKSGIGKLIITDMVILKYLHELENSRAVDIIPLHLKCLLSRVLFWFIVLYNNH